ncbi:coenzyme F420-0:L-glutamate ligase, partial [Candidatus Bathyarchaeota archaeon]
MEILPIKTKVIKAGDNLAKIILDSIYNQGIEIKNGDIIAISSKVISTTTKRIINLKKIKPSNKAQELAKKYS